ncbi:MAG: thiamine pyrophosphate-binding protein [Candidatus Bathyarchaeota archaeon]|nr:thiamine pyrophosphate-binding protein [Candidatus Bathyarchaeota archaeon]
MNVNDAIQEALRAEDVQFVFGLRGGFDLSPDDSDITPIQVRYEGSAPFMAMAYAMLTGTAGVCAAASGGNGLTNMVSGVLEAYSACVPLLTLVGRWGGSIPSQEHEGMGAFAECDNVGVMKPVTKWSVRVPRAERMPWFLHRAFSIAHNGRPGPVVLEVPMDVMKADVDMPRYTPSPRIRTRGDPKRIRDAITLLLQAKRPLVVAGGGTILSQAFDSFQEFVEVLNIPFLTTPQGRSILPEDHPLALGLCGVYINNVAKQVYDDADLLVTIGSRMEALQSVTFQYFPEHAQFIQIDIEPEAIGLNWVPDLAIVGDARLVLQDLIHGIREKMRKGTVGTTARVKAILKAKQQFEADVAAACTTTAIPISPKQLVRAMNHIFGTKTILCNENGANDIWSYIVPYYKVLDQWSVVPMGEETCFGSGIAGAIGAKLARPDMHVLCPTGDGAFQHYNKELATAAQYRLGITWVIFNNHRFGGSWPTDTWQFQVQPDFVKLAEASQCYGIQVERPSELTQALETAKHTNQEGIPAVVDVIIQHDPSWGPWGAWGSKFPTH